MTSLQGSISSLSSSSLKRVNLSNVPKLHPRTSFSVLNVSSRRKLVQKSKASINTVSLQENDNVTTHDVEVDDDFYNLQISNKATLQLYAILEAVCDRIETHNNLGEQRNSWNSLLLNSINMITLSATTMAGIVTSIDDSTAPLFALKLSSTLLFSAATAMSLVMSKIQPSQLAEEQRNATRLFRQIQTQIQTKIALGNATEEDVKSAIEKILALDKAYPLPLLGGAMLEKFPTKFQPAIWWPSSFAELKSSSALEDRKNNNGWSEELEMEMREVIEVIKRKDMEDYDRLGNLALKMNKVLAISGPLLTGIAALGSALSWGAMTVPVVAGALASVVNAFEHGGQVGMVLDMYRYCGGFFKMLEETTEATLEEENYGRRENGEIFEMKVALRLGRSVLQLRELASKSAFCRAEGTEIDEFASKLF